MQTILTKKSKTFTITTYFAQNIILIAVFILIFSPAISTTRAEEKQVIRTWTSAKGDKIQATFIGIKNNNITLKTENGKLMKIRLSNLSTADQAVIKKMTPPPSSPVKDNTATISTIIPASPNHLATYNDGKWKKYNTIFTSPKYDAAIDKDMNITIYLKDKDKPVGQTVFLRWGTIFLGPARKSIWCKVTELKTKPEPAIITRTTTIELKAKLDHNIDLELTYIFSIKGISVTGRLKEPKSRDNPSRLIYAVEFKPIKSIKEEMSYQEMKSALTGYFLLITNKDGKKEKLPFWQNLNPGPVREVTTIGPWGPRKIIVKTPMEKKRKTRQSTCGILSIYTGTRPHGGYRITRTALIDSKINTQIEIE